MGELKLRCDFCGKEYPQSQIFIIPDDNWNLIYICRDCVKKKFGIE